MSTIYAIHISQVELQSSLFDHSELQPPRYICSSSLISCPRPLHDMATFTDSFLLLLAMLYTSSFGLVIFGGSFNIVAAFQLLASSAIARLQKRSLLFSCSFSFSFSLSFSFSSCSFSSLLASSDLRLPELPYRKYLAISHGPSKYLSAALYDAIMAQYYIPQIFDNKFPYAAQVKTIKSLYLVVTENAAPDSLIRTNNPSISCLSSAINCRRFMMYISTTVELLVLAPWLIAYRSRMSAATNVEIFLNWYYIWCFTPTAHRPPMPAVVEKYLIELAYAAVPPMLTMQRPVVPATIERKWGPRHCASLQLTATSDRISSHNVRFFDQVLVHCYDPDEPLLLTPNPAPRAINTGGWNLMKTFKKKSTTVGSTAEMPLTAASTHKKQSKMHRFKLLIAAAKATARQTRRKMMEKLGKKKKNTLTVEEAVIALRNLEIPSLRTRAEHDTVDATANN
ncbi:hypothetical protein V1517DRAFT_345325 [Lipomyces orientalis]|uniref:Uncharacterized protein n=1 Tax=Lipomyces orientalis TaxID=1233043 RepID=A0ACC3TRG4_9ASCO